MALTRLKPSSPNSKGVPPLVLQPLAPIHLLAHMGALHHIMCTLGVAIMVCHLPSLLCMRGSWRPCLLIVAKKVAQGARGAQVV